MRSLRIASISLLALLTAAAASDISRHCRRAANARAFRSRTDQDHLTHATIQALDDFTLAGEEEIRTGGQVDHVAVLADAATERPSFFEISSVVPAGVGARRTVGHLPGSPRGPPIVLS